MNGTRDERRERARTAMQAAWMELGECPYDSEYERALDIIETFGYECERAGLERAAQLVEQTITTKHWYSELAEAIRALAAGGRHMGRRSGTRES